MNPRGLGFKTVAPKFFPEYQTANEGHELENNNCFSIRVHSRLFAVPILSFSDETTLLCHIFIPRNAVERRAF